MKTHVVFLILVTIMLTVSAVSHPKFYDPFEGSTYKSDSNKIDFIEGYIGLGARFNSDDSFIRYPGHILPSVQGTIEFFWKPPENFYELYSYRHKEWKDFYGHKPPSSAFLLDNIGWRAAPKGSFIFHLSPINWQNPESPDGIISWSLWDGRKWHPASKSFSNRPTLQARVEDGKILLSWSSKKPIWLWDPSKWYKFTLSWGPKGNILYVNGEEWAKGDYTGSICNSKSFSLGQDPGYWPYGPHSMLGIYDEFKVYDKQFEPERIHDSSYPVGYIIYYGTQPGNYSHSVEVGNIDKYELDLPPGVYHISIAAKTDSGFVGPLSKEVVVEVKKTRESEEGWILNPESGHLYKVISCGTWGECEREAVKQNAHLVTINDEEEQRWLLKTFGTNPYWIGLTDYKEEGNWRWISGEAVTYTNWFVGEPDNSNFGEDYAVMNLKEVGKWSDIGPHSSEWKQVKKAILEKIPFKKVKPRVPKERPKYYDDFSSDSGMWEYVGSARRDPIKKYIVLVDSYNKVGLVWFKKPINSPFVVEFRCKTSKGNADGFTFMFYKKTDYEPGSGGYLGFVTTVNKPVSGYGIEFDDWSNEWDPKSAHVALIKDDVKDHLVYNTNVRINDGKWHDVRVVVSYYGVRVYIDGDEVLRWDGKFDTTYSGFGFSGATGLGGSNTYIIDDVKIYLK